MRIQCLSIRQAGATVVEFALVLPVVLLCVFAIMELARAIYLINILQEVTRRAATAAVVADFSNLAAMEAIRNSAVLDEISGRLVLGDPIRAAHVRIDYLAIARDASGAMTLGAIAAGDLPSGPAGNRVNCIKNPYGSDCIRMVRVRICDPADASTCNNVRYQPMLPIVNFSFLLPQAATLAPAETLGLVPGAAP